MTTTEVAEAVESDEVDEPGTDGPGEGPGRRDPPDRDAGGSGRRVRGLAAAVGLGVLGWLVYHVGLGRLTDAVLSVGWGLPAAVGIHGLVVAATFQAWRDLLPNVRSVPTGGLFRVKLVGDAINVLTPLGGLGGEPYRVWAVSRPFGRGPALRSVLLDRFLDQVAAAVLAVVGGAVAAGGAEALVLGSSLLPSTAWERSPTGLVAGSLAGLRERVRRIVGRIQTFLGRVARWGRESPGALVRAFGWRLVGRLLSVVELAVIVAAMGQGWLWKLSVVAIAANIGVGLLFTWIPGAIGAAEAGFVGVFVWAGLGAEAGLAVALVRRLRGLAWTGIGLLALLPGDGLEEGPPASA